jgi:anaerobic magnesium-protoporphyrin IX monomethyl ester cyclase
MKICLVAAPWDTEGSNIYMNFPPLGLAYLAGALNKAGYTELTILDPAAEHMSIEAMHDYFKGSSFDIVGISSVTITYPVARSIALIAKGVNRKCCVVMGGPHVTVRPLQSVVENPSADYVVVGEGERTFTEFVDSIAHGRDPRDLDGLAYMLDGKPVMTNARRFVEDLDEIPYPMRHLMPLGKYHGNLRGNAQSAMVTSRGCPGRCTYCGNQVFGTRFRFRSAANVLGEMRDLIGRYGVKDFAIHDDAFTADPKRAMDICGMLIREKLGIRWSAISRANLVTPELLVRMKDAGCWLIEFGIESGSDETLQRVKKGLTVNVIKQAFNWAHEAGLITNGNVMIGLPGDTRETIAKTEAMIYECGVYELGLSILVPYPGTEEHERLKSEGRLLSEDWASYAKVPRQGESFKLVMRYDNLSHAELVEIKAGIRKRYESWSKARGRMHLVKSYVKDPSLAVKRIMRIIKSRS